MVLKLRHRKTGLALGSGGARGWAHVGVARAIRELGIEIACVAGTSMGALVGAAFAAGKIDALRDVALELDWRHFLYYFLEMGFPKAGLVDGARIVSFLKENIGSMDIEDLPLDFAAVATDVESGDEVIFREGNLSDAVRASIAIPGIFTPFVNQDRVLVDGGLVNPLPVNIAREMGADLVIAVDVLRTPQSRRIRASSDKPVCRDDTSDDGTAEVEQHGDVLDGRDESVSTVAADWLKRINDKLHALDFSGLAAGRRHSRTELPGMFDVLGNSIRIVEQQITRTRLKLDPPDILIQPEVQGISTMEFHKARQALDAGYNAALQMLQRDEIRLDAESVGGT